MKYLSMISNVTLAYINLRLCEVFDTSDVEDGWFGKKTYLSAWGFFATSIR